MRSVEKMLCVGFRNAIYKAGANDSRDAALLVQLLSDLNNYPGELWLTSQSNIHQAFENWPTHSKKKIYESLKQLQKHGKIYQSSEEDFDTWDCPLANDIVMTRRRNPRIIVRPDSCHCQRRCQEKQEEIAITMYPGSIEQKELQGWSNVLLVKDEWTWDTFADKFLQPILEHAHTATWIDRNVGRHWEWNNGYDHTIETISQWITISKYSFPRLSMWTLITECPGKPIKKKQLQERWNNLFKDLSPRLVFVTRDTIHHRFLVTNQAAWSIDRGLDLLQPNGNVRDLTIQVLDRSQDQRIRKQIRIWSL